MNISNVSYILIPILTIFYGVFYYFSEKGYVGNNNENNSKIGLLVLIIYFIAIVLSQLIFLFIEAKNNLTSMKSGSLFLKVLGISIIPWLLVFFLIHFLINNFDNFREPFAKTFGSLFVYLFQITEPLQQDLLENTVSRSLWYGLAAMITVSWAFNWTQSAILNNTKPVEVIEKEQIAYEELMSKKETSKPNQQVRKITD